MPLPPLFVVPPSPLEDFGGDFFFDDAAEGGVTLGDIPNPVTAGEKFGW